MASIRMKRGVTSEISNTPISDGQILFETDTKNIYIDEGSNRIKYRTLTVDIDNKLSTTSKNPVQNKIITTKVNGLESRVNAINPQADSGYVIIGDTLIQWGKTLLDTRENDNCVYVNISFPMPFADKSYSISLTLNYSVHFTSYYDAIPNYNYANMQQNGFQPRVFSKSGGFTTTSFPTNSIAVGWIVIGKYDATTS